MENNAYTLLLNWIDTLTAMNLNNKDLQHRAVSGNDSDTDTDYILLFIVILKMISFFFLTGHRPQKMATKNRNLL